MRQRTIDALKDYYNDGVDATTRPRDVPGAQPALDLERKERVILQAIKELVQDNADQQRTIDALVAQVGLP
jgi:hypothetical protein